MKNIRHLCAGFLVIIIVIITLCSCSNDRSEPTNAVSPAGDVFHELTLPAVTEGQVSVLDARGSRILYVREEKLLSKDGGYAYYETKQVGIYDVDAQKSLAVWEPETPGNYFGGALLDGDAAILALQIDYTNAYPAQFAAMYFGGSQRSLVELTGELQWLLPFSGKEALASYRTEEGAFGVYRLSADGCTDALLLQADANTEPMGGDLAVCGPLLLCLCQKWPSHPVHRLRRRHAGRSHPAGVCEAGLVLADRGRPAHLPICRAERQGAAAAHALCLWRDARGHTPGCGRRTVSAPLCKRLRLCREWQLGASAPAALRGWHGQLPRCNGVAR